jgi:hypothetical protein
MFGASISEATKCDRTLGGPTTPGEYTGSCTWCNGDVHSGSWPPHNNTNYADTNIATDAIGRLTLAGVGVDAKVIPTPPCILCTENHV